MDFIGFIVKSIETHKSDLSVIIPVKDEEKNLTELVSRLSKVIQELKAAA